MKHIKIYITNSIENYIHLPMLLKRGFRGERATNKERMLASAAEKVRRPDERATNKERMLASAAEKVRRPEKDCFPLSAQLASMRKEKEQHSVREKLSVFFPKSKHPNGVRILLVVALSIFCICVYPDKVLAKEPEEPSPLAKEDVYNQLELFADTITIINANYVDEVEPKDLIYGALRGMLRSLDLHSDFLTPEKFEDIKIDTGGEFGGLGIEITIQDNILTIVTPLEDTPAYKAGLMPNDKIIKIDDESTKDFSLDDAVKRMRGKPGTEVTLTIMREGEERLHDYTIKRALIKIPAIKDALILEDSIGYIRITDFQQNTSQDLEKALRKLQKEKFSALILDLRNNPGGLLDTSIDVAEKFLPKDAVIVSIKGRIKAQENIFKSKNRRPRLDFPIVILVNKGSASASEIVAAAIKDNKRGVILGTPTFGKGSVQTVIPLRDGSALRLTTSKYYTPSGEQIHKTGVAPDVLIEKVAPVAKKEKPEDIFEKLEPEEKSRADELKQDNQIRSAIELLKGINVYRTFK